MKFYSHKWNDYTIEAGHQDIRSFPVISWLPYFWDNDIAFDIGVKTPNRLKQISDTWSYHWVLRDLDGHIITQGDNVKQGDGNITISNKGLRRRTRYWNSGKSRAVVLGNLHPHKEYMLYAIFVTKDMLKSDEFLMASFTVEDRTSYQMQLFLILFTIMMTLVIGVYARACGVPAA